MPVAEAVLIRLTWINLVFVLAAAVRPLAAQDARDPRSRVPESFTAPAGLCRLWIDGVPASQQPAPTDCAMAIRNRPGNATVVFGPQHRRTSTEMRPLLGRSGTSPIRRLTPGSSAARVQEESRARERAADSTAKANARKPERQK